MKPEEFFNTLDGELGRLVAVARRMNEIDLAAVVFSENRGEQSPGWSTVQTAYQVHRELVWLLSKPHGPGVLEIRHMALLYAQLSEAGGLYESLKNLMGVVQLKPYNLWPFHPIRRKHKKTGRLIGPNSNKVFQNLAEQADEIGMPKLRELLELAFRDDLRNAISHADYVIWKTGFRLPDRNGMHGSEISYAEFSDVITRGLSFFELLTHHQQAIAKSFQPGRRVYGRFSMDRPSYYNIESKPGGGFSISTSSADIGKCAAYERQQALNNLLGGRVAALYGVNEALCLSLSETFEDQGLEPHIVIFKDLKEYEDFWGDLGKKELANEITTASAREDVALCAHPWGVHALRAAADVQQLVASWPNERLEAESATPASGPETTGSA
jgi:hypothetical protein